MAPLTVAILHFLLFTVRCGVAGVEVPHMHTANKLVPLRRVNTSKCIFIKAHRTAGSRWDAFMPCANGVACSAVVIFVKLFPEWKLSFVLFFCFLFLFFCLPACVITFWCHNCNPYTGSVISSILHNMAIRKNLSVLLPPASESTSPLWRMERKEVQRVLGAFSNSSTCTPGQYDVW